MKSKKQLVFSLPVHEQYEVVLNQIENINHFCSNSGFAIVIHVSKHFKITQSQLQHLSNQSNVYINPTRLFSGYLDGSLLRIHLENAKYAQNNFEFEYLVFLSSNMMFIRTIPQLTNPMGASNTFTTDTTWPHGISAIKDITLKKVLNKFNKPIYAGNKIDGWYLNADLLALVIAEIDSVYPKKLYENKSLNWIGSMYVRNIKKGYKFLAKYHLNRLRSIIEKLTLSVISIHYATEEIYFSSIVHSLNLPLTENRLPQTDLCYIDWINYGEPKDLSMVSANYCLIKPVNRSMDSPLRRVITSLMN